MKKIPTIFIRDPSNRQMVLDQQNPACDWVFAGEGIATRKYDGTCCLIENGKLYKRREIKKGKRIPENFVEADSDETTGKIVGWMPVDFDSKDDQWHAEAFTSDLPDGTYELIGPKAQGNAEGAPKHMLIPHDEAIPYPDAPRDFFAIIQWLTGRDIEGLVWHHPDGRMAKIKKRDFGLKRGE